MSLGDLRVITGDRGTGRTRQLLELAAGVDNSLIVVANARHALEIRRAIERGVEGFQFARTFRDEDFATHGTVSRMQRGVAKRPLYVDDAEYLLADLMHVAAFDIAAMTVCTGFGPDWGK